ncbi:MAG: DUF1109 domain-containing protein [Gammaproteobacteria bacterium]|nr:DUF1109 domain-containing protein [Gammaproteobacteria bacterium]
MTKDKQTDVRPSDGKQNNSQRQLIRDLVADLQPSPQRIGFQALSVIWIAMAIIIVTVAMLALGPIRPGAVDQLLNHPQFTLEMLFGVTSVACFTFSGFSQSIPGTQSRTITRWAWGMCALWVATIVLGFQFPWAEASMLGKREHCTVEAYFYFVPTVVMALWLQQRRFPLYATRAAISAGMAAGLIPAIGMQLACMYEPGHILEFHVAPLVAEVCAVVVLSQAWQRLR